MHRVSLTSHRRYTADWCAHSEARLLTLAYSWERLAAPRKPPFSAPPLVSNRAPAAIEFDVLVESRHQSDAAAHARFSFDITTSALTCDVEVTGLVDDQVVGVTLQTGTAERAGPIVSHLLLPRKTKASVRILLSAALREDLLQDRLFMHLYTRKEPLGVGRARLLLEP